MRVSCVAARLLTVLLFSSAIAVSAQMPQLPMQGPKAAATAPVALPPSNPNSPPQLTPEDVTAFLDGFLPLQLQRDDVAGATISITQNGQTLIQKGYGYADWKKKTPVDPVTTTFRPGSISKTFTYVSMMQLVEQGKLDLDADVSKYIDFTINPGGAGIGNAPITLRELCTHTAGFEEELHDFGSDKSGKLPMSLGDFLKRNQPKRFAAPGKALAYSNYGIGLVGYIVQRVSGEPFVEYVQRHILGPLGMTHSTFEQPLPAGMVATKGYLTTDKPDTGFEGFTESSAGGLSSTAADMAIFGQMLLGHGTYHGVQILQPASVATLLTPQFTPAPGVAPWDLGFYTERRNGLDFIGHGGDLLACHSQFWIEQTHGLSFFISYNSAGASKIAREELFRALVDRYLPGAPSAHPAYV
jgi:CubicO group peptidase (beta-lactamase class C family)